MKTVSTVNDPATRFDQERQESSAPVERLASFNDAQRRFSELSRRTRNVLAHPVISLEPASRLRDHAVQTLALSRLVCDELQQAGSITNNISNLVELLNANEAQLNWLADRVHAAELFRPVAWKLRETMAAIVRGSETSCERLRSLAVEFLSAGQYGPDLNFETAADVTALGEIFVPAPEVAEPRSQQALMTAWCLIRLMKRESVAADTRQRMVIAALVQDVGYRLDGNAAITHREDFQPYHPATGAALLAGLSGLSSEVALLVGGHHERADGSGYPQRRTGANSSRREQQFAIAVRLAELLLDPSTAAVAIRTGVPLDVLAGVRLWHEMQRGAFHEALVREAVQSLRADLATAVEAAYPQQYRQFLEPLPRSGTHLGETRQDAAESAVNGPRFLQRRRSSQVAMGAPSATREGRQP